MSSGFCLQSQRADRLCPVSNNAVGCARTVCPDDDNTILCLLTKEIIPRRKCPCKTPCADLDAQEVPT